MPEEYWFDRGYPFIDRITVEDAQRIYERVRCNPGAGVSGDLVDGFSYVVDTSGSSGAAALTCVSVRPIREGCPVS